MRAAQRAAHRKRVLQPLDEEDLRPLSRSGDRDNLRGQTKTELFCQVGAQRRGSRLFPTSSEPA